MKQIEIAYLKYEAPTDLVVAYFRFDHPRMKLENLLKQSTEFQLHIEGTRFRPGTVSDVIQVVARLGVWGFCDKITNGPENPKIHYWVSEEAKKDRIKVMELFAHEVAHAAGYSSENMAIKFGGICAMAYMSMMDEVYGLDVKAGDILD